MSDLLINPYRFAFTVTTVLSEDFTGAPAGDNVWLPETGWDHDDYDDGGETYASSWHTFNDGGSPPARVFMQGGIGHCTYDVGTEGMEVEARMMLYTPDTDRVAGIVAAASAADPLVYVGLELSLTSTTDELVVYYRNGGSHTHLLIDTGMGLVAETWYKLKLRYHGGVLTAWFDDVQWHQETLTGTQQTALSGHTRGGLISFVGWSQWDWITLRSVT